MSKITEALIRRDVQDTIYIGEVAERLYNGQQGELLRALINGLKQEEAVRNFDGVQVPSDMVLGRIQAYQTIIDRIEFMIQQKEKLMAPKESEPEQEY